ncbi:pyridoxamine 5'-phosphate oxidase family protein [Paraburkholderia sp.]|uniref:pyridoxamine 5'-phosphate oxidase family protein n=1 Tax=Paraburkholderia sp. TaxID=1926495 RepID=UPI00286F056A|nr:pyridoxamine 5'-phosphate oxidase family protein [Paraburkholderia sp.]
MMLNDAVLSAMKRSVLCWLATVDSDGCPNVSPKEIFCAYDSSTLLIANIASPGSAGNIARNPAACVSFVDPFVQKGFKLKGKGRLVKKADKDFEPLASPLAKLAGPRFPFVSLFVIDIASVEPIVAPSYRMYPDTSESQQIESAMKTYGVRSVSP